MKQIAARDLTTELLDKLYKIKQSMFAEDLMQMKASMEESERIKAEHFDLGVNVMCNTLITYLEQTRQELTEH